METCVDTVIDY